MREIIIGLLLLALASVGASAQGYKLGHPPSKELLEAWDIDVRPDGAGLPAGKGTVKQGQQVYTAHCAACHGDNGEGKRVGGAVGTFDKLEDQMCAFGADGLAKGRSPDRLDALVWALTELMLKPAADPKVRML